MQKTVEDYTQKLIEDLNLQKLSSTDQEKAILKIRDHLQNTLLTVLVRTANPEQKKGLERALAGDGQQLEQVIIDVSSEIPGFAQDLEDALLLEYENLKLALNS